MTPFLIEALGRLAPLSAAELALVSATAATLAAGTAPSPPQAAAIPQPNSAANQSPPMLAPATRPSRPLTSVARHRTASRSDYLGTVTWATSGAVDPNLFASATYRERLGPTVPMLMYCAGSEGFRILADGIGRTVFKVGVTESDHLGLRLSTLAASRYGSCIRQGEDWMEGDGFSFFSAANLPLERRRGSGSPIRSALRAIAVDRPASLPLRRFDQALRAGLESASLHAFSQTPDALALCLDTGLDPAALDRYTPAPLGRAAQARYRRATELALFAPRAQADDLADLAERIIADHVMA